MLNKICIIAVVFVSLLFGYSAEESNILLGRGINLGNALEAPNEGDWGVTLKEEYFPLIKSKGFNSVRIPIRWYTHADSLLPFTVDSVFFSRVDWVINNSLSNGLAVLIDMHHYETLYEDPGSHHDQFVEIWRQISRRYKDYSDSLMFEILNEPHSNLGVEIWNTYLKDVLDVIRTDNPTRTIIIGPADWGGISALNGLVIPDGEDNVILSIHYYSPFEFTHQGAEWVEGADAWLGTTWDASGPEKQAVVNDLEYIKTYAENRGLPVYIGEFGAYSKADMLSRSLWTEYCARLFEKWNYSWSYWEFCSGYGIYNDATGTWYDSLVNALISDDTTCLFIDTTVNIGPNLLRNGDFSNGSNYWLFGAWSGIGRDTVIDETFISEVTDLGDNSWDIQLLQDNLSIDSAKEYYVSFHALSASEASLSAGVMRSDNYSSYGGTSTLSLTSEKKSYSFKFNATESYDNVRLVFNLGHDTGEIKIDNVIFAEWEPTSISNHFAMENNVKVPIQINNKMLQYLSLNSNSVILKIYNFKGQKVFSKRFNSKEIKFSLNDLINKFSGSMIIQIEDGDKTYKRKWLISE